MVEDNNELFLKSSIFHEVYEKQREDLKQWCKTGMEETDLELPKKAEGQEQELNDYKKGTTRTRSGSIHWLPPESECNIFIRMQYCVLLLLFIIISLKLSNTFTN